jgi:hypothetical protein
MLKRLIVCDACGTETELTGADGWIEARTYIASQDFMSRVYEARNEGNTDDGTNHGDFCSLLCLANWASAQANLRDLDDA